MAVQTRNLTVRGRGLSAAPDLGRRDHVDLAPRRDQRYHCARGHHSVRTFAADVEPPTTWPCRCGDEASAVDSDVAPGPASDAAARRRADEHDRHLARVRERRTDADAAAILAEALASRRAATP